MTRAEGEDSVQRGDGAATGREDKQVRVPVWGCAGTRLAALSQVVCAIAGRDCDQFTLSGTPWLDGFGELSV